MILLVKEDKEVTPGRELSCEQSERRESCNRIFGWWQEFSKLDSGDVRGNAGDHLTPTCILRRSCIMNHKVWI